MTIQRLGVLLAAGALLAAGCSSEDAGKPKAEGGGSSQDGGSATGGGDGSDAEGGEGGETSGGGGESGDGGTGGEGDGGDGGQDGDGEPATPGDAPADPDCPEPGVRVMPGPVDGDDGLRLVRLMMINCGTEDFPVSGYPDVRVLGEGGKELDVELHQGVSAVYDVRGHTGKPQRFTLKPGQTVESVAVWRPAGGSGGRALKVAPSEGDPWQKLSPGGLEFGGVGELAVSPWKTLGA
ncbi:DUF4232 domain-containing protein [Streptomyces sp. WMMC897]|uniref:DUF4232 domain-containing protein n=1 Tax=Streptomyces sp. WMMC897 TaxID=3014782 RepID=UPI0022B7090F|nr:DUF4232 domain-containing protein [Streptomyces sp. WMMC897]MCZ7417250.1 DUF4232 domain-containing protein [Streptomyces sp. WMMC897]